MTTPRLPAVAVSALLASKDAGQRVGPTWAAIEDAIQDTRRAELLRRVAPPGDWLGLTGSQVRLLALLLDGERWPRAELSKRLKLSDRKVRDDIEALRHMGFPVVSRSSRKASGYRLTSDPAEIEEWLAREVTPRAMRQLEVRQAMRRALQRVRASALEGAVQPAQLRLEGVA